MGTLTNQQAQTLKTLAQNDASASVWLTGSPSPAEADRLLAEWFNTATSFVVWRSQLTPDLARQGIIGGLSQLDALTAGKRDSLLWVIEQPIPLDANTRAALDDLMGSQNTLKASMAAAMKRAASRAETALATGTGTTASPGSLGWEGPLTQAQASQIRSS